MVNGGSGQLSSWVSIFCQNGEPLGATKTRRARHFARPQVKAGMSELRAMVEFDQWHLGHEKL